MDGGREEAMKFIELKKEKEEEDSITPEMKNKSQGIQMRIKSK